MTLDTFLASLAGGSPPAGLPPLLRALWLDAQGDWDSAHHVAQEIDDGDGAWVHAYLHRKEGDAGNAGYWYRRSGRLPATGPLADEWRTIVETLLASTP